MRVLHCVLQVPSALAPVRDGVTVDQPGTSQSGAGVCLTAIGDEQHPAEFGVLEDAAPSDTAVVTRVMQLLQSHGITGNVFSFLF